jgi:hypothetical protein
MSKNESTATQPINQLPDEFPTDRSVQEPTQKLNSYPPIAKAGVFEERPPRFMVVKDDTTQTEKQIRPRYFDLPESEWTEAERAREFEIREDFGPNGDGTTPGFFKSESPKQQAVEQPTKQSQPAQRCVYPCGLSYINHGRQDHPFTPESESTVLDALVGEVSDKLGRDLAERDSRTLSDCEVSPISNSRIEQGIGCAFDHGYPSGYCGYVASAHGTEGHIHDHQFVAPTQAASEQVSCANCGEPFRMHDNEDQQCPNGTRASFSSEQPVCQLVMSDGQICGYTRGAHDRGEFRHSFIASEQANLGASVINDAIGIQYQMRELRKVVEGGQAAEDAKPDRPAERARQLIAFHLDVTGNDYDELERDIAAALRCAQPPIAVEKLGSHPCPYIEADGKHRLGCAACGVEFVPPIAVDPGPLASNIAQEIESYLYGGDELIDHAAVQAEMIQRIVPLLARSNAVDPASLTNERIAEALSLAKHRDRSYWNIQGNYAVASSVPCALSIRLEDARYIAAYYLSRGEVGK